MFWELNPPQPCDHRTNPNYTNMDTYKLNGLLHGYKILETQAFYETTSRDLTCIFPKSSRIRIFFFFFKQHWFQKRILWMFPSSALCSFSFLSLRAADFSSVVCVTVCEVFTSSWSSVGGSELVHSQSTGPQPAGDHLLCIGWNQHSVRHVLTACELTIDSTQVDLMFVADTKLSANSRCTFSLLRLVHPQIVRKPMCSYFLFLFFTKLQEMYK